MTRFPLARLALAAALTAPLLSACAPILVVGAVSGAALVATDRRSTGAQLDDTTIETKVASTLDSRYGSRAHIATTSYNGMVLLSGESPDSAIAADAVAIARGTDRVRNVYNEIAIMPPTDLATRTNDSYTTSKVKARFVESSKFSTTHVKVVTERGVVYLMGVVSRDEASAAAEIASTTSGAVRVVRLFEVTG
ncbi:MAG: BON domain-containing protein [Betaproteobacteria bacterium]